VGNGMRGGKREKWKKLKWRKAQNRIIWKKGEVAKGIIENNNTAVAWETRKMQKTRGKKKKTGK
jgi:hypothetical protein